MDYDYHGTSCCRNVGNNVFPMLPASGLQRLLHLKAHNNPNLRHFHPPELFPRIQTLVLSYAYHCCEFMPLMDPYPPADADDDDDDDDGGPTDFVILPNGRMDLAAWANATEIWSHREYTLVMRARSRLVSTRCECSLLCTRSERDRIDGQPAAGAAGGVGAGRGSRGRGRGRIRPVAQRAAPRALSAATR